MPSLAVCNCIVIVTDDDCAVVVYLANKFSIALTLSLSLSLSLSAVHYLILHWARNQCRGYEYHRMWTSIGLGLVLGPLAQASPREDHHRIVAAAPLRPPPEWKRRPGRPRLPGYVLWKTTSGHWISGWILYGAKHSTELTGDEVVSTAALLGVCQWMNEWMNEWMNALLIEINYGTINQLLIFKVNY